MSIYINDKSGATPQQTLIAGISPVDQVLNGTSKNAIANKAVYNALADKIEKTVNDLVYYYNTSQTYNKAEVRELIGAINTLTISVVSSLPTQDISTTTIYFLGPTSGKYDEYVYVNNAWVKIGDTEVDLSGYMTTAAFTTAIADYYTKAEIDAMIAGYYTKAEVDTLLDEINTEVDGKQDKLTFDNTPIVGSSNPVKSSGIKSAIDDTATDIYEVMGKNGAKNLFKNEAVSTSQHNITFTVNTDGSVRANTSSETTTVQWSFRLSKFAMKAGTYVLSDGNTGDFSNTCFLQLVNEAETTAIAQCTTSHKVEFTLASDQTVILRLFYKKAATFNYTYEPMIRFASDTDSTYQPYAETNYQLTQSKMSYADNGILGAKNLLPLTLSILKANTSGGTWTNNVYVKEGVTFTVSVNSSDFVTKINIDGTTSSNISNLIFNHNSRSKLFLEKGQYIISKGNTNESVQVYWNLYNNSTFIRQIASLTSTESKAVTIDYSDYNAYEIGIHIPANTTITNTDVYPMIRLATDTDSTYQPYAMTNRELTEHHTTVAKTFTQSSTDVTTYLRNANTSGYIAFGYSYNRTMITVNAIFTVKASGNALYKSDGTTATSGNENWELIKIPNFPYSKAIPDGPLSGLLFLNRTDLKDLYCSKRGNDLIFAISATDYADFVGKGIRLSTTIMLQ